MNPILTVSNLYKAYVKGSTEVTALRNVSLKIQSSEFISIVGRSGSGKSTLLNMIGGLDTPDKGQIHIHETELTAMSRGALAVHRRETVGMIFQSFNLIPSRTALENISLALAFGNVSRKDRKERAEKLLMTVGLIDRMDHKPGELSGGECQRVAIARALANNPVLLLADEPTGNLDSATSTEILALLQKLNRDKQVTIIMITHDQTSTEQVSDRIFHMLDGEIVKETQGRRQA